MTSMTITYTVHEWLVHLKEPHLAKGIGGIDMGRRVLGRFSAEDRGCLLRLQYVPLQFKLRYQSTRPSKTINNRVYLGFVV